MYFSLLLKTLHFSFTATDNYFSNLSNIELKPLKFSILSSPEEQAEQ